MLPGWLRRLLQALLRLLGKKLADVPGSISVRQHPD